MTALQPIDGRGTLDAEQVAALRVRNALLELLRSWEAMHDLPTERPVKRPDGAYTNREHKR